ncbi:MAG: Flp pilus assembly protein CpaB [Hyphomicrobiaceae bacterium]|nr:Flp pilus assembly protein CpaB [Hyphomicrobiaceae bacterium]
MKALQLGVGAVAIGAGVIVMVLLMNMQGSTPPPAAPQVAEAPPAPKIETEQVLVTTKDINMGATIQDGDLTWTDWPKANLIEHLILKSAKPNAIDETKGSIARVQFLPGEPVREARLMKAERGFMSVILPQGARAIAVEVKASSLAGGFILPNDHVDIILTRAAPKGPAGGDAYVSETILTNIRVLAINQKISEEKGEATALGETATLELSPRQVETMAQAQQLGTISLALRSIVDSKPDSAKAEEGGPSGAVRMVRYGVISRVTTRN